MTVLYTILWGLLGGSIMGMTLGFLAAQWYMRSKPADWAMAGFFGVGPLGFAAGFLLTSAWYLSSRGGALWLTRGASVVGALLLCGAAAMTLLPDGLPAAASARVLHAEIRPPEDWRAEELRWMIETLSPVEKVDWPFQNVGEGVLKVSISVSDNAPSRTILVRHGETIYRLPVELTGIVREAQPWGEWKKVGEIEYRWEVR